MGFTKVVKAGNKPGSWVADFRRKETALEAIAAHNVDAALVEALRDIERILNRRKATYAQYAHGIAVAALATLTPGEPAHE